MSHEIRTPMNAIMGMTELVLDSDLNPSQRESLNTVLGSAGALLTIINEILDFSKIEAGKLELDPADFDLRFELAAMLKPFQPRAVDKNITLSWSVQDDVPQWIHGDWNRLRQMMINLVGNAIKFTASGNITVDVSLQEHDDDDVKLRFQVVDTGLGIPPDKLDSVFAAFEQVDMSTTRNYGGTGLGLAITKRLADAMNGQIGVESQPGSGSTFHFAVWLKQGEASDTASNGRRVDLPEPKIPALNILLAEDGKANQLVAVSLLSSWGHTVEVAENGQAAVDQWKAGRFDAILMDVQMPIMDGLDATRQIRLIEGDTDAPILIIAVTAHAMKGDRDRCLEAGMDDFVTKPIARDDLTRALSRFPLETDPRTQMLRRQSQRITAWRACHHRHSSKLLSANRRSSTGLIAWPSLAATSNCATRSSRSLKQNSLNC